MDRRREGVLHGWNGRESCGSRIEQSIVTWQLPSMGLECEPLASPSVAFEAPAQSVPEADGADRNAAFLGIDVVRRDKTSELTTSSSQFRAIKALHSELEARLSAQIPSREGPTQEPRILLINCKRFLRRRS